jgi:hypothetical protein
VYTNIISKGDRVNKKEMAKQYILTPAEYRKKLRNEERLSKIADKVDEIHQITRQIKRDKRIARSKSASLKTK